MRDFELIKNLKKPVKVILCGMPKKINTEYIDLAYQTKGSIHTIEEDIKDILLEIKEGEIIEINHQKFKLKDGEFVLYTPKKT